MVRIDTAFLHLNGCHACGGCFKTGKACAFDDDFNRYAADMETADAIIVASQVYWYSVPGLLKTFIDNIYCFMGPGKDVSGKKYALLACAGEPELNVFDGMKFCIDKSFTLMGWEKTGEVLVPACYKPGDIENTDTLERVEKLVESL
ncbi:MAG: NAD(P)H-dependent oxidoreductase [Prevotella sp.]|nr:NAD(P)H-dependent oxidoreductase [Prevotella sp.]